MAKAIGIEIEAEVVRIAVVDGTPKRFVLTDYKSVPIERDGDDAAAAAPPSAADISRAIKAAMRDIKIKRENLGIAVDTSRAVIREHTLPFAGDERIRQVLKFEIESKLPQMGVDDVIVDYYVMEESEHQSKLLVAALPKKFLEPQLRAAATADCDPQVADISAFALFNAVAACNRVPAQGNAAFVHVLDDQILFLLTEDGGLRQVRSLKGGAGTLSRSTQRDLGEAVTSTSGLPRAAKLPSDIAGNDQLDDELDEDLVVLQDEAPPTMELARGEVGQDLVERQTRAFISRLGRDLRRTVFALRLQRNTPLFVSGRVDELPGFLSELSGIFGGQAQTLDLLEGVEHSLGLEGDELAEASDCVPIAFGVALHMLGADFVGCNFRQEDLRFSRSFDLLKVPLAFGLFFLFLFLALENVYVFRELNGKLKREQVYESERAVAILIDADLEYAGYVTGRSTPHDRWLNRLQSRRDIVEAAGKENKDAGWPKIDHLEGAAKFSTDNPLRMATACDAVLRETLRKLQAETGGAGGVGGGYDMPPSTLDALWNVFVAFDAVQKEKNARIKIDSIETRLILASRADSQDSLELRLNFVVFTDDVAFAAEINSLLRSKIAARSAVVAEDINMNEAGDAGYAYDLKVVFEKPPQAPDQVPAGE